MRPTQKPALAERWINRLAADVDKQCFRGLAGPDDAKCALGVLLDEARDVKDVWIALGLAFPDLPRHQRFRIQQSVMTWNDVDRKTFPEIANVLRPLLASMP